MCHMEKRDKYMKINKLKEIVDELRLKGINISLCKRPASKKGTHITKKAVY